MYRITKRRLNTSTIEIVEIYSDENISSAKADFEEEHDARIGVINGSLSPIINNMFQVSDSSGHFEYKLEYYSPITDSIFDTLKPVCQN